MSEHLIRLRRGWGYDTGDAPGGDSRRPLALPLAGFPTGSETRARISRGFQTPAIDPLRESLWLRLDAVPGLVSVVLNRREIARAPFPAPPLMIPLGNDLPARNLLILDVERLPSEPAPPPDLLWGDVALVIRESAAGCP